MLKPIISSALNFREKVHNFSVFFFFGFRIRKRLPHPHKFCSTLNPSPSPNPVTILLLRIHSNTARHNPCPDDQHKNMKDRRQRSLKE